MNIDGESDAVVNNHSAVIFQGDHARQLLKNKYILILGDSVQRTVYKDVVALLHNSEMLTQRELAQSCEKEHRGDQLVAATMKNIGDKFMEVREYAGHESNGGYVLIRYVFMSRIWESNGDTQELLDALTSDHFPDVLLVNSLFWDVSKYGDRSIIDSETKMKRFIGFENNLHKFIKYFENREAQICKTGEKSQLRNPCLKIWRSTMPISETANTEPLTGTKSNMVKLVEEISHTNYWAEQIIQSYNWDIIDAQFWFRQNYIEHRSDDGIHWNAKAHRWLTNIILTHIAIEWGIGLPTFLHGKNTNNEKTFHVQIVDTSGNDASMDTKISKDQLKKGMKMFEQDTKNLSVKFPDIPSFSK